MSKHGSIPWRCRPAGCLWALCLWWVPYRAVGATWHVPGDYATIQAAVDAAGDGDEVIVGPGTYRETVLVQVGVVLRGPGLDGETAHIEGDGSGGVVRFVDAPAAVFEGFEVSGAGQGAMDALILLDGSSPDIRGNLLNGPAPIGVLASQDSDPHIEGNRFLALDSAVVLSGAADPTIADNMFANSATVAIHIGEGCSATILDNTFQDNDQDIQCDRSNAPWLQGNLFEAAFLDSVTVTGTSPTVLDNTFRGALGVGLRIASGAYPDVEGNWFDGNAAGIQTTEASPSITSNWFTRNTDAAILVSGRSYPTIYQNVFQDNHDGVVLEGSVATGDASPHILNNTIVSGTGAGIRCVDQAYPAIGNNIIAFNGAYGVLCQGTSLPTLAYNDVYGNAPADFGGRCSASDTDLSVDPEFVAFSNDGNPDNDDLHTNPSSPTRDAGNPFGEYDDPDGSRNDLGAYGGPVDPVFVDVDGDGYRVEDGDCNDADPAIHPGAVELVDGIDNNCDGIVDAASGDDDTGPTPEVTPTGDHNTGAPSEVTPTGDDDSNGDDTAGDDDSTATTATPAGDDDTGEATPTTAETPASDDDSSGEEEETATPGPAESPTADATGEGEGCSCGHGPGTGGTSGAAPFFLAGLVLGALGWRSRKR